MNASRRDDRTADDDEVDPTHLQALAQRVQNLGEADDRLADEVKALRDMLEKRLPTEDEMKNLRELLSNKAGREYVQRQLRKYGIGGIGLLAMIYATRAYLSQFLAWLSGLLK